MWTSSTFARFLRLPGGDGMGAADLKHVQSLSAISVVAGLFTWVWSLVIFLNGWPWMGLHFFAVGSGFMAAHIVNSLGRHTLGALTLSVLFYAQMAFATYAFGFKAGTYIYFPVSIIVLFMIFRRRDRALAYIFTCVATAGLFASILWQDALPQRYVVLEAWHMALINTLLSSTALGVMALLFVKAADRGEDALEDAHKQVNDLLLNAIPASIAERLKNAPDKMIADRHESVSIMFVDIVGFTKMSEAQQPEETLDMLNDLFTAFDEVCSRYGIEKIRTIGDGYMVVAGAPEALDDHEIKLVEVGLAFLKIAQEKGIDIRIGMNCGEVVGGIVGTNRFHYDVWGDAVNVAARMETAGKSGKIHLTDQMATRVSDSFICTKRPPIEIKGKGVLQTWFVEAGN